MADELPAFHTTDPDGVHLVFSMGVYNPSTPTYLDNVRLGQLLVAFLSVSKTTPNCHIHFIYTGVDNGFLATAARVITSAGTADFDPVFISADDIREALRHTKMNNIGTHSMVRLALPDFFPDMKDCIWVDCDVVVFDDLNKMLAESRAAIDGNRFMFAGSEEDPKDYHGCGIVNAGMMYMNLDRMREPGAKDRIIGLCDRAVDNPGAAITVNMIDQDVVNALGIARISRRWNITLHNFGARDPLPYDIGCLHFTGEKKYAWSPYSETPQYFFLRELSDELLSIVPTLPDKWLAVGSSFIKNDKTLVHVSGRPTVYVNDPQPVVADSSFDSIDVAYGVSGDKLVEVGIPVSMLSVAENSSVPVNFHVVYIPGRTSEKAIDRLMSFGLRLQSEYGGSLEAVPLPERIVNCMEVYGDHFEGANWNGHLVSFFLHDALPDVDLCVKMDVDTLCVGDMKWLVKYCADRGLGSTMHAFGCRSLWRDSFCAEFNFGVSPQSFSMLRESGMDGVAMSSLKYGCRALSDEIMSRGWVSGMVGVGMYPNQWNMVARVRENLLKKDVSWYQSFDVFYGKKYRVDGYEPILTQGDYRLSAKVYHYTFYKPWEGNWSSDPDSRLWDRYAAQAESMKVVP